ncbi:FAD-dependent oxidoreductase [Silvimonas iriomotensis]|uniref:Monooxygenase n=1 Tax=Silvimonas iriomotensis TaxID=449662 RepID=A0ABQ2PE86_9NEIS|nr:FAD-dependent oxidoreductase [Silvimonas iriomotensis]GGP23810.1 monooxygenase [Silvimonas iriomotensis]
MSGVSRRQFLLGSAALGLAGCSRLGWGEVTPVVNTPGMSMGHALRDHRNLPAPSASYKTGTVILGSGVAGLAAGWRLARGGYKDFMLLAGPEHYGNAAGGAFGALQYPKGAHYLPLPSMESRHVRDMLFDAGVIEADPYALKPRFDERVLVHAPDERVFVNGRWEDGLLPLQGQPASEREQQARFFRYTDQLKQATGADGKRVFCIPVELSSADPHWLALDQQTFAHWLDQSGYTAPGLRTYLDYCCRDDFGAVASQISAWAGLHYFAARAGQAANASEGAVLTWPGGLNPLARHLAQSSRAQWREGMAVRVDETRSGVQVLCAEQTAQGWRTFTIEADRAICAMPLHVAKYVVPQINSYGFDAASHMPPHAAWVISSFLLDGFPAEEPGAALAWDNVIHGGRGLGYVVSTHQDITWAPPPQTVFTAYQVYSDRTPQQARQWLEHATPAELYEEAACDLRVVYGRRLRQCAIGLDITVRGHAMASPAPGFMHNAGLKALRGHDGKILFAHSDLSGFSVFEEASWWGVRAAEKILG